MQEYRDNACGIRLETLPQVEHRLELPGEECSPRAAAEPAEPYGQTVHIHFLKAMYRKEDAPETMRPGRERSRGGGVRCSDEEKKKKKRKARVKREVGGEEKCSECLRAAQLEERMECGSRGALLAYRCVRRARLADMAHERRASGARE